VIGEGTFAPWYLQSPVSRKQHEILVSKMVKAGALEDKKIDSN
jgi:hypothetical protein